MASHYSHGGYAPGVTPYIGLPYAFATSSHNFIFSRNKIAQKESSTDSDREHTGNWYIVPYSFFSS